MTGKAELTSKEWRAYGVLHVAAEKRFEKYDLEAALRHLDAFVKMLEEGQDD